MRLVAGLGLWFVCCSLGFAEGTGVQATLSSVNDELESVIGDLEANQSRTLELQARLVELEALSTLHVAALAEQDARLAAYAQTVQKLEAHDTDTLTLLDRERAAHAWLVPVAITATALATLEALLLLAVVAP